MTRSEYIAALEAGHHDTEVFVGFIADRVIMTQLDILRLFRESEQTPNHKDFEQVLLQTITQSPGLNAPLLSNRLGRSLRTTQRYLKVLTDKGQISLRRQKRRILSNDLGIRNAYQMRHFDVVSFCYVIVKQTLQNEEKMRFYISFCCIIKEKCVNLRPKIRIYRRKK